MIHCIFWLEYLQAASAPARVKIGGQYTAVSAAESLYTCRRSGRQCVAPALKCPGPHPVLQTDVLLICELMCDH